jgi:hypothetical protein
MLAALFAVHPLHVESVAWAVERKDVLSTFLLVLTIRSYLGFARTGSWRSALMTTALFILGLLAKPMLVTLPFALLLLDVWPLRRVAGWSAPEADYAQKPLRRLLSEKAALFGIAIAFSVLTFHLQKAADAVLPLDLFPVGLRIATALNGYVWYLWKTLVPTDLCGFYPIRLETPIEVTIACAAALVVITMTFALAFRRHPELLIGWLWFCGTLFPVSGIAQSGQHAYADRFAYVPHIGLFVVLIWGAAALVSRFQALRVAAIGILAVALAACTVLTFLQVRTWHDSESFYRNALRVRRGIPSFTPCWALVICAQTNSLKRKSTSHARSNWTPNTMRCRIEGWRSWRSRPANTSLPRPISAEPRSTSAASRSTANYWHNA